MSTFTWRFPKLEVTEEGVITRVHYELFLEDDGVRARVYGDVFLPEPKDPVIDLKDVTETEVLGWVADLIDVPALEDHLRGRVAAKKAPTVLLIAPPWAKE